MVKFISVFHILNLFDNLCFQLSKGLFPHPPYAHFDISFVPASPIIVAINIVFSINMLDTQVLHKLICLSLCLLFILWQLRHLTSLMQAIYTR